MLGDKDMTLRKRLFRKGDSSGYTLIELMIALVIMSVGLFAVVHLQFVSIRGVGYARERTDAFLLANAISDDLKTRGLRWTNNTDFNLGANPVFPEIVLVTPPSGGADLTPGDLSALTLFNGTTIAPGPSLNQAGLINAAGIPLAVSADPTNPDPTSAKAIYRVHYTAYQMPLAPGIIGGNQVVRLVVFVSWDNNDYGEQGYAWTAWNTNFWKRHMVAVNVYLRRQRQG